MIAPSLVCKSCGTAGYGKYCGNCGQSYNIKRLSVPEILHEIFHYFTHLDHGFGYTFKMLITSPGQMQKDYVEGDRVRHQKPFSMFFLCATISGLIYYLVNTALTKYMNTGDVHEAEFFRHYWVIFHICLLPLYCLITWLTFIKSGYNYGEVVVQQLYTFSILFLMISLLQVIKLLSPDFPTRFIELPLFIFYATATNLRFFTKLKPVWILVLSLVCISGTFILASTAQDIFFKLIYPSN